MGKQLQQLSHTVHVTCRYLRHGEEDTKEREGGGSTSVCLMSSARLRWIFSMTEMSLASFLSSRTRIYRHPPFCHSPASHVSALRATPKLMTPHTTHHTQRS